MKTTTQVYEQDTRVSKLLWEVTSMQVKKAHPETGGSLHLAHNWGNEEAQKILSIHMDRQHKLYELFKKYYRMAFKVEYPDHSSNK